MYNFNHLYYFYITVKSGGVTIAAKNLSISQPSLSGQLKVLEEFLQKKLFKKVGRKNELTRDGAMIYGFCRQMFELSEEMHETITEEIPHASRRLYIGVSNEVAHSFVVEIVSHFLKRYTPKLRPKVKMLSGSHEKLVQQLRFREIDVLISQFSARNTDLTNLEKVEVPVNLVCSAKKKNISTKKVSNVSHILKEVLGTSVHRWVVPSPGFKLRAEIDQFFETEGLKGDLVFESDVVESITRSVVDQVGISFLPLVYIPKELEYKSILSFGPKQGFWKHRIWISCHSKSKTDNLINSFSQSFKDVCTPLIKRQSS